MPLRLARRASVAVVACGIGVLAPSPAEACAVGAISIAWPNDGLTGVPPDSAVLFGYELTSDDGLCPPDAFEVRVVDLATDLPVAGAVRFWNHGSFCAGKGATMRWVPAEPLLANAAYRVSIESDSVLHQGSAPVGAQTRSRRVRPALLPPWTRRRSPWR